MDTNRDLYLAILALIRQHNESVRNLEEYLIALRSLSEPYKNNTALPLATFYGLLEHAFTASSGSFNEGWRQAAEWGLAQSDYDVWDRTIVQQIVDLNEMRTAGTIGTAFFGVQSPRGNHWVNTTLLGFLECATVGSVGGWQPGDDGGRQLVPGDVAYVKADGSIGSAPAEAFDHPVQSLHEMSWDLATDFLRAGQHYE
jgi:hypothetical protein